MAEAVQQTSDEIQDAFALLAEMTQGFADTMDLDATLARALASIRDLVDAEEGSLWMLEPDGEQIICVASVGLHPIDGLRLPVSQGIVGKSVRECACQQVFDASNDPHFSSQADDESGAQTRSLLCSPMTFSDEVIGAVEMINKRSGSGCFEMSDAHLLKVLASSAGLAIANARLSAAKVEHEKVRREMELAAEIQRGLLPESRPAPFPIYGINVPARTVSGDFFDIQTLANGRIAFCLGDVSGKGMNAALLMAKTASLYRCLVKTIERPAELLCRLNSEVYETATRGMFVTMAAGVYDPQSGVVCISNAGHEPPLYATREGSFSATPADAPPLGILPDCDFTESEIQLEGGTLYLCSDGLTEAIGGDGESLGSEGLERLAIRYRGEPVGERITAIVDQVGELLLRDDLTLLGVSDEPRYAALEGRLLERRFPAEAGQLASVRKAVEGCVLSRGAAQETACDVVRAVDEACQNIIRHAYADEEKGDIVLEIDSQPGGLIVSLTDFAPRIDPRCVKPRDLDDLRPGGLGTHLIREIMDSVEFLEPPPGCGNLLRMIKRID
ncbi:MAG: SpoIIE family protein phosphatase [Deltaproteobacteria bacterium]|nr:SpoIIE family protein phosphatase [Deltaproteobacteria bacterium]